MTPALLIACTLILHDGDSGRCSGEKVRVAGIEAAELEGSPVCLPGKPAVGTKRCDFADGERSAAYAKAIVARATSVKIHRLGKDPYCKRTIAHVYLDGQDFASLMVKAGHAWRVKPYARKDCGR